jgi:hypothetical protein
VYVRENGEETREIPDHTGKFLSAAVDGSKVLLSDGTIFDLGSETSTDLTEGSGGFQGLVGQSDDLTSVYFVATTVLTGLANDQGAVAQSGQPNLYSWQNGAVTFVATLLPNDNQLRGVWNASPVKRAAEASPSGRWLTFNSKAELTGVNSVGACEFDPELQKYVGSVPCEEVYLYDSQSGALICASCNPVGAHPLGGSFLRLMMNATGFLQQPRYLTNDGRLYFDSRDALSGLDTNNGVEDVYQYQPTGIGSCAKAGGCVSLISSGRGSYDSNFLATDSSGTNVFFTTRQRLVPIDQDALIDLYDARVGGGFASEAEAPPKECQAEGCQPLLPAPAEPMPNSSGPVGSSNVTPPQNCKKGQVKRRGKCVKKTKHKKHGKKAKQAQARSGGWK